MANRKKSKEFVDIRVSIDMFTDTEIKKYQANRVAKDGADYKKWEAASDLFMELVKRNAK